MPAEHSFLVIRLGSLGDIVHTVPAVAALREAFPGARIDWVAQERWIPLIEMIEGVDRAIPLRRSFRGTLACIRELRRGRYRCAIDFQGLYKSALLPFFGAVPRRIGRDRQSAREPGATALYTETLRPEGVHVSEMSVSLARHAGARGGPLRFPMRAPEPAIIALRQKLDAKGIAQYVLLSPGGGWRSKCWPAERYGLLGRELWRKHGVRSIVNVGPGEEAIAREVVGAAGEASPLVMSPSLGELAALSAKARLVVAADTGPLHLAAALGALVVGLFGATSPERNGPRPGGRVLFASQAGHQVEKRNAIRGNYQRGEEYSPAMLSLAVEEVLAAAEEEMSVRV